MTKDQYWLATVLSVNREQQADKLMWCQNEGFFGVGVGVVTVVTESETVTWSCTLTVSDTVTGSNTVTS